MEATVIYHPSDIFNFILFSPSFSWAFSHVTCLDQSLAGLNILVITLFSIITQVIIEILALSLAESYSAIFTSREVIIAEGQFF